MQNFLEWQKKSSISEVSIIYQLLNCPSCGAGLIFGRVDTKGQEWYCPRCGCTNRDITYTYSTETYTRGEENGKRTSGKLQSNG